MSISVALGLLLSCAAALASLLEVTRETRDPEGRPVSWRFFAVGALTATVVLALAATFALFRTVAT